MISFVRIVTLGCASLLFFSFSNCKSSGEVPSASMFQSNPPFSLTKATYQEWTAGTQQGGSGININLWIGNLEEDAVPQQFYFRNQVANIVVANGDEANFHVYYKKPGKPDIIMDGDIKQEAQNTPPLKFPFKLKENEAAMSYIDHDVVLYYKIVNMQRLEPVFYPSAPPRDEN